MQTQYEHKAEFYEQGRLGYAGDSIELIAKLVSPKHSKMADVGCGTGLLSEALLNIGYTVYGVEPDDDLRQKAKQKLNSYQNFTELATAAENTGLPSNSIDGIIAASAVHWFDIKAFLCECKRIIKPNGYVFFIYNVRETNDLFSQEHENICQKFCPEFSSFQHGADMAKEYCPIFFSDGYHEERYPYKLVYTKERFLSRCLSSSYSLSPTQPDYFAYQHALRQLIDNYAMDGVITVANYTVVWYGKIDV